MLQSIVPAFNLKNSRRKLLFRFFHFFYWSSLTFGYLQYSTLLTTTAKRKYYSRIFAFIRVELQAFSDQQSTFTYSQGTILQSRDLNLHLECAQKKHEANISVN